jgi:hypothetical protein
MAAIMLCEDIGGKEARCIRIGHRRPDCDPRCEQQRQPTGYVDASEWGEYMSRTHEQRQCPGCGLWTIWEPKAQG